MKNIVKRYIKITVFIVSLLIIINSIFIKQWTNTMERKDPQRIRQFIDGINISDKSCTVSNKSKQYINDNDQWMMVLSKDGSLVYSYKLPKELKRNYELGELIDYSKWYIEDYPIEMMNVPGGLVVLGNVPHSIWKLNLSIEMKDMRMMLVLLVLFNILITIVLAYLMSLLFMKELNTVVSGILDVSQEEETRLEEKGYLKDIKIAINKVSQRLNDQKRIIKETNAMKEEWLAGVTHDIRTPLSVIVGKSEELQNIENDYEKKQMLETIKNQSFKITFLVNDLNLINKLDSHQFILNPQPLDLCKLIRECIADVMNIYASHQYDFVFDQNTKHGKIYIEGDAHLLKRAFHNVLINSIVHNEQGCCISIKVKEELDDVIITFSDNGVGMSEEKIKIINNGKQNINEIHGWGSVVVKRIIGLHSGTTEFRNNNGMEVNMTLPKKLG